MSRCPPVPGHCPGSAEMARPGWDARVPSCLCATCSRTQPARLLALLTAIPGVRLKAGLMDIYDPHHSLLQPVLSHYGCPSSGWG